MLIRFRCCVALVIEQDRFAALYLIYLKQRDTEFNTLLVVCGVNLIDGLDSCVASTGVQVLSYQGCVTLV